MFVFLSDWAHEHRGYKSEADRQRAKRQLERKGARVISYKDTQAEFALMIARPTAATKSQVMLELAKVQGLSVRTVVCQTSFDFTGLPS